ncbi:MAG TPA: hypothetical protein VF657_01150 [Actinoplanes sp.]|jgi:hypothetical protein
MGMGMGMGMGIVVADRRKPTPRAFYEVLGRVMAAIRDASTLSGVKNLDWWSGAGGREWHIEWVGGAFPHEVAAALLNDARAADSEGNGALRGCLDDVPRFVSNGCDHAVMVVSGVPVHLRAWEPVGADEAFRQALTSMSEANRSVDDRSEPAG